MFPLNNDPAVSQNLLTLFLKEINPSEQFKKSETQLGKYNFDNLLNYSLVNSFHESFVQVLWDFKT